MQLTQKPGRVSIIHLAVLILIISLSTVWITFTVPDESDFVYRAIIPAHWISPDGMVFVSTGGIDIYWGFGFGTSEFSLRKWPRKTDLNWFERCGLVLPEMRPGVRPNRLVPNQGVRIPFWLPLSILLVLAFFLIRRRWRMLAPFRSNDPYCETCGYLLKLNASGRCPECGSLFDLDAFERKRNTTRIDRLAVRLDHYGPIGSALLILLAVFFVFEPASSMGKSILDGPKPPAINREIIECPNLVAEFEPIDELARKLIRTYKQSENRNFYDEEVIPQSAGLCAAVQEIIAENWLYQVVRIPETMMWPHNREFALVISGLDTDKPRNKLTPNSTSSPVFYLATEKPVDSAHLFPRKRFALIIAIGYSLDLSHKDGRGVQWGGVTDFHRLGSYLHPTRYYGVLLDSPNEIATTNTICKALAFARNEEHALNSISRASSFGPTWERPCPKTIANKIPKD